MENKKKDSALVRSSAAEYLTFVASTGEDKDSIEMRYEDENIWLTQKMMATLYDVGLPTINEHIKKIYADHEQDEAATIRNFRIVQNEGGRQVTRSVNHYNLQMIIAVGFKVNNQRAVRFRVWANQIVEQYTIKGWAMDEERLKNGGTVLTKKYFEEQLERIREIRISERNFYQKLTDIYATSLDYDRNALTTKEFFAKVQNKMHYAVHRHTAAELIYERADAEKPHMGLHTWKDAPNGKIKKSDVSVAKNYLTEDEMKSMELIVSAYLDLAENRARRHIPMTMEDWAKRLDIYLQADDLEVLKDDIGKVTIPLPPIEIQSEIVHTLDNYTENVVKLQNQLTAELTARQKQYTFYRNKLLTFSGNEKAKIVKISLGDIGPICMCKRILKSQTNTVEGVPFYKIGTFGKKADAYISKETFDEYRSKYSFPKKGDVLISAAGTIGRTVVYDGKPAYFQDSNIVWIDNNESVVLNSYLRYCYELKPWKVSSGGTIQRLYNDNIAKAIITVPPLDVQNRIVNVLDNFEKICSDLNIGLPAEIEARQKQYEYYRDKLLTFVETGNTILSRAEQSRAEQSRAEQSRALIKLLQYVFGYAVVSLQDVVKNSCSGGTPKKGVSEYYEDGNIPWLRTQEVVFRDICKTECFITESAVKNSAAKWIPENCVIVAISGATAGRCAINKIPLTTNQHCLNLEVDPEMALYRYVYYCICAKQEELLAKKEGARGDLNSTRILSLQIDLPSIEKQKRIVSILDRFDAICNDLTSGLPAEIEARQKQYEYYRDMLLSFKELN